MIVVIITVVLFSIFEKLNNGDSHNVLCKALALECSPNSKVNSITVTYVHVQAIYLRVLRGHFLGYFIQILVIAEKIVSATSAYLQTMTFFITKKTSKIMDHFHSSDAMAIW